MKYKLIIFGIVLAMVFLSGCSGRDSTNPDNYKFTDIGNGVLFNPTCDYKLGGVAASQYISEHPQMRVISFSPASNNEFCGYYMIVEERIKE